MSGAVERAAVLHGRRVEDAFSGVIHRMINRVDAERCVSLIVAKTTSERRIRKRVEVYRQRGPRFVVEPQLENADDRRRL